MSDDKKASAPAAKAETTVNSQTLEQVLKVVAEQLIPAAVASAIAATRVGQPQAAAPGPRPLDNRKCNKCKQHPNACEGKHVDMVVYPTRYPHTADYFIGVVINGVKYLSNDDSHLVTVPAVAVSDILNTIAQYEINEQEMAHGRVAERHSGSVSPNGNRVSQANAAWR